MGHDDGVNLNRLALARCNTLIDRAPQLRVAVVFDESGTRLIDCGVHVPGGIEAGRSLVICRCN